MYNTRYNKQYFQLNFNLVEQQELESPKFYSWYTVGFLNIKQYRSTVLYWSYIFYDPILRSVNYKRVSDQNIINYQEFILDWRHTLQMPCIDHNVHQSSTVNFLSSILMTTDTRSATLQSTYLASVGFGSLNLRNNRFLIVEKIKSSGYPLSISIFMMKSKFSLWNSG